MKILLLDGQAVCHTILYALPKLSHGEVPTQIIYGFMVQLLNFQKMYNADRIVFVWDSRESKRREIFPEYKAKRRAKQKAEREALPEEEKRLNAQVWNQFSALKDTILPELGFNNIFSQEGYEGDDIAASVCRSYPNENIIMVSNDQDWFQLVTRNHVIWYLKGKVMITERYMQETYGISAKQYGEAKTMFGCVSDECPGIKGIGEGKAIQYLKGELKESTKAWQSIKDNPDTIEFTRRLVQLPFEGVDTFRIQQDSCNMKGFRRLIREYGLNSFKEDGIKMDLNNCFCTKTCQ